MIALVTSSDSSGLGAWLFLGLALMLAFIAGWFRGMARGYARGYRESSQITTRALELLRDRHQYAEVELICDAMIEATASHPSKDR